MALIRTQRSVGGEIRSAPVPKNSNASALPEYLPAQEEPVKKNIAPPDATSIDDRKRGFIKLAGLVGLGVVASQVLPAKAEAYVMGGGSPSVVGVKDSSNTRIDPATDATLQRILTGQGVTKLTTTLSSSGVIYTPTSGKSLRVYATRFSLTADLTSVSFRFTSGGTDHEVYLGPVAGGLYGSNNHPNYVQGGVNQQLYCVISGTGSVQINIDYLEV